MSDSNSASSPLGSSQTPLSPFGRNGLNANGDTAGLRLQNVIPRNQVFAQQFSGARTPTTSAHQTSGFYQGNSATRSRGVPAQRQVQNPVRYGNTNSPRSTVYRNKPFDEYDSDDDCTDASTLSFPLSTRSASSRQPRSSKAVGKQPVRRIRSASTVQRPQRDLSGAWSTQQSVPLQPMQSNRFAHSEEFHTPYVEDMEVMNDNIHNMDGHNEANSTPSMGLQHQSSQAFGTGSEDATLAGRRPSRTNTKMSLPTRKRSSAHILESKIPKIFRVNVPAADDVADLEANKGHGHHGRFGGWAPDRTHTMEYIHAKLSKRLEAKNLIVAGLAEFMGTFLFLFFALAINTTVANVKDAEKAVGVTSTDLTALLVSSLGFGFSLVISAWVFFRVSGGVQNPAITLALTIVGALDWKRCIVLSFFQYLGGVAASGLITGLYTGQINSRTTLGDGVSVARGFWLEFFLSIELIFTVLMLACEKHRATYLAPVGIGLALFNTQLLGQPYTGASVNPARTLGPDVAQHTFSGYCWIYYVAPYLAALFSAAVYLGLKWIRYETTAPDQDADEQGSGLKKQVIIDGQGNIIGTIDEVHAEEYDVTEIEENEKGETTIVGAQEVTTAVGDHGSLHPTSSQDFGPHGKATIFPEHDQYQVVHPNPAHATLHHPRHPEPAAGIEPRGSSLHGMAAAPQSQGGTSLPYISPNNVTRH